MTQPLRSDKKYYVNKSQTYDHKLKRKIRSSRSTKSASTKEFAELREEYLRCHPLAKIKVCRKRRTRAA